VAQNFPTADTKHTIWFHPKPNPAVREFGGGGGGTRKDILSKTLPTVQPKKNVLTSRIISRSTFTSYSYSLRAWGSGDRIPVSGENFRARSDQARGLMSLRYIIYKFFSVLKRPGHDAGHPRLLRTPSTLQYTFLYTPVSHFISIQHWRPGLAGTRGQSCDRYGSGTLHPGQILGGSFPLLSPAFRCSHFSRQVPPPATTREILAAKGGTMGEKDIR